MPFALAPTGLDGSFRAIDSEGDTKDYSGVKRASL